MRGGADLAKFLAPKGSVCLDGVSLTVASLHGDEFEVASSRRPSPSPPGPPPIGWPFNFEADIISKTVVAHLERRQRRAED